MSVFGEEHQIVLDDERRDPEVVGRDGRAFASQLHEDAGVVMRRLLVRVQHFRPWRREEPGQRRFVPAANGTGRKAGAELGEHDEGKYQAAARRSATAFGSPRAAAP